MDVELVLLLLIGFFAQLVDGALGMAFGVISTTGVLSLGMPPAQASALVHTAEMFTTGASGAWHIYHRNVDWRLTLRLGIAGVLGAVLGAWMLSEHRCHRGAAASCTVYLLLIGPLHSVQGVAAAASRATARRGWLGRRSASSPAFSMPAAAAAGGRSRPRRCSAPARAAQGDRFGQHRGILRHGGGGDHLLRRARRCRRWQQLVPLGARRSVGRAVRRMGGEAHTGARADDRGRLPDRRAVRSGSSRGLQADLKRYGAIKICLQAGGSADIRIGFGRRSASALRAAS